MFSNMTYEERQEALEKAQAAAAARREYFRARAHLLKSKFRDMPTWRHLASALKVRMPAEYLPCSELKYARRALRVTGVDFVEVTGMSLRDFPKKNPTWPAYALVGLILEHGAERNHMEIPDLPPENTYADVEDLI